MVTESTDKNNNDDDDDQKNPGRLNHDYYETKSYSFNGKVVLGIGIIMVISAITTICMAIYSESPRIHLSVNSFLSSYLVSPFLLSFHHSHDTSSPSQTTVPSSKVINKRIILIQQDFGWNGTDGGPPIIVNKGDIVQLVIINRGHMAHNFGIGSFPKKVIDLIDKEQNVTLENRLQHISYDDISAMPCPGCQAEFKSGHVNIFMEPGTQQTSTFVANKVGHFKYYCMVRGHLWLGMFGDLIVKENTESSNNNANNAI